MKEEELIEFISKELNYDAAGGTDCPHCGRNIIPHRHWIDHKGSLASNINTFLGFKSGSWRDNNTEGMIYREIEDFDGVTGKSVTDSKKLGEIIWNLFYE